MIEKLIKLAPLKKVRGAFYKINTCTEISFLFIQFSYRRETITLIFPSSANSPNPTGTIKWVPFFKS